jgi:hypothetical protein
MKKKPLNPRLKKKTTEEPPPKKSLTDAAYSLKVDSTFQGFTYLSREIATHEKVSSICEKINSVFSQPLHSPDFAEKPSFILNTELGKIKLSIPPMTKVIFAQEGNLLATLGFKTEAFLKTSDEGKYLKNENPTATITLESATLLNSSEVTLKELLSQTSENEQGKIITIKIGYGPIHTSISYELLFPSSSLISSVSAEEKFSDIELKRIFEKTANFLIALWNLAKESLTFEIVNIGQVGTLCTWRLDMKIVNAGIRHSSVFVVELTFGNELKKKLGLIKSNLKWSSAINVIKEKIVITGTTDSSSQNSSHEKLKNLDQILSSPKFAIKNPRSQLAILALFPESELASTEVVKAPQTLQNNGAEDEASCSRPKNFPKNYAITLREGEHRDFISERGAKAILALINESGNAYPKVLIKQWNQIEALHIEFIDVDMQNVKLDSTSKIYLQADLQATLFKKSSPNFQLHVETTSFRFTIKGHL